MVLPFNGDIADHYIAAAVVSDFGGVKRAAGRLSCRAEDDVRFLAELGLLRDAAAHSPTVVHCKHDNAPRACRHARTSWLGQRMS